MDQSVQVRALVDMAAKRGPDWLEALRDEALAAVTAGDVEVNSLAFDGGSGSGSRKFKAQDLLEVTQLALEQVKGCAEPKVLFPDFASSGRTVQT
jgi:hypothetical protein